MPAEGRGVLPTHPHPHQTRALEKETPICKSLIEEVLGLGNRGPSRRRLSLTLFVQDKLQLYPTLYLTIPML